jgi:hypothetical protein
MDKGRTRDEQGTDKGRTRDGQGMDKGRTRDGQGMDKGRMKDDFRLAGRPFVTPVTPFFFVFFLLEVSLYSELIIIIITF